MDGALHDRQGMNTQLSTNFWSDEFKGVMPRRMLLDVLQEMRDIINNTITITDSIRSVEDHIRIYQDRYSGLWLEHIPWGSYHLPIFTKTSEAQKGQLRAVDLKAVKSRTNGKVDSYWKGAQLAEVAKLAAHRHGVCIGLGTGDEFIHLDVREKDARWKYNY